MKGLECLPKKFDFHSVDCGRPLGFQEKRLTGALPVVLQRYTGEIKIEID